MTTIWRCSEFSALKLERLRIHPVEHRVLSNDAKLHVQKRKLTILEDLVTSPRKSVPWLGRTGNAKALLRHLLLLLATILLAVVVESSFPYPLRASCLVQWRFVEGCDSVIPKLREQIQNVEDETSDGDYLTIKATRVEPKTNAIDCIHIVFANSTDSGCIAMAQSEARHWYSIFDDGRNYCNLWELIYRAGYDFDDFIEETENADCTQYNMVHCC
ncbi:uncharacterized protein LOC131665053 [Phymastichus coffea]|uniref:uncharacterized protein LOC131665053 n=1 Tax=Phymastichus coffea TaxID=108790 RepID=UPI00273BDAD0|nr:uncharacterized protein LOC131665053 [Phymastichus coffea]